MILDKITLTEASVIAFIPSGTTLVSTNVEDAIKEVDNKIETFEITGSTETSITGGGTESPSSIWSHTDDVTRISLTGNLVINSVEASMPTGPSVKIFTHSGYTLTISLSGLTSETNFTNRNGEYKVLLENIGTPSSPIYRITDVWKSYGVVGGGVEEAPIDTNPYVRKDGAWAILTGLTGGGSLVTTPLVIPSSEVLELFSSGKTISNAPGSGIIDITKETWVYVDYKGVPYSGSTKLNLLSNSTIIGTCDCLGSTTSGWYKFTWMASIPEINAVLSVKADGSNPYGGDGNLGIISYYDQIDLNVFTFPTNEIVYDDFTGSVINVTDKWTLVNGTPAKVQFSQNNLLKIDIIGTLASTAEEDYLISQDSTNGECSLAIDWLTNTTLTGGNMRCGIFVNTSNWVGIYQHSGGQVLFAYRLTGTTTAVYSGYLSNDNYRFRVSINASNKLQYWVYIGGVWTEIDSGNNKTFDLGSPRYGRIMAWNVGGAAGYIEVDRVRFAKKALYSEEVYNG